ncbi:MAG: 4Fe-4S binding protein [Firmicutes bacterium]|nr:4Fe-4S binding protein [Bacillota bacterium]MCM1400705.1 4Fe-4S binding protein [Bacteroides sp.]
MMTAKIIRLTRIVLSVVILGMLTCALCIPALAIPGVSAWLEKIQLGPAILSFSLIMIVAWLLVTLAFGRVYCSTACPMGTVQDLFARVPRLMPLDKFGRSPRRYRYAKPLTALRYTILLLTLGCLIAGFMTIPSVLEPFSAFNRICNALLSPALNTVSEYLEPLGLTGRAPAMVVTVSASATLLAAFILCAVAILAMNGGRTVCNTVCPVGTALGCVSRYAIYQMDIDTDLCIQCGKCADACKGACIDLKDHTVDGSRCVVCFDCAAVCPNNAIRFTRNRKQLAAPLMQRIAGPGRQPQTSLNSNMPCSAPTPPAPSSEIEPVAKPKC